MKKILLMIIVTLSVCTTSAQRLVVYSLMGNVEDVTTAAAKPLKLRDAIKASTILNIPYHGCVVLYDERSSHIFTLKTPGRATVKQMIADTRNSILTLSADYMAYVKKQIAGSDQVQLRNCSDPATVTRDLMITGEDMETMGSELHLCGKDGYTRGFKAAEDAMMGDFEEFRRKMLSDYQNFRNQILRDYANFVRNPWKEVKVSPAEDMPIDEKVEPLVIDEDKSKPIAPDFDRKNERTPAPVIEVLPNPQPLPQPEPVVPIKENKQEAQQTRSFSFFGTQMKVRWSDECVFRLRGYNNHAIADGIELLSDAKYDNVLYDCLQRREEYHFSDWAYYLMLKEMSDAFCGKGTNEAALLTAFLYSQSGYRMRLALAGNRLLLMVATQFKLYGHSYYEMDGHDYYILDGDFDHVYICPAQFPKEQEMSLVMKDSPRFTCNNTATRTIGSRQYTNLKAEVSVNKNLLDFYSTYPTSEYNNDLMTRWAMYANIEMQPEVRAQLYPQLKAMIEGKTQCKAVESILNWIQTAFPYEYDDTAWGHDRAFFAEESLFYPACDCEDRSILFTRLIRDLMGLKCILVYYPGHLATGVCFTEEQVRGDYIDVKGSRFTICDPTIMGYGAPVGHSMSDMDNSTAKVIVLD